jgi:hypothetical protein
LRGCAKNPYIGFLTGLVSACQNDLNAFTIDGLEHTQSSTPTIEPTGNPLFEYTETATPKPPTRTPTSTPTQSISNFPKIGFIHYYQEVLQQTYPLQIGFSDSEIVFRPLTKNASCHIKTLAEKTFTLDFELEFETDGCYTIRPHSAFNYRPPVPDTIMVSSTQFH